MRVSQRDYGVPYMAFDDPNRPPHPMELPDVDYLTPRQYDEVLTKYVAAMYPDGLYGNGSPELDVFEARDLYYPVPPQQPAAREKEEE